MHLSGKKFLIVSNICLKIILGKDIKNSRIGNNKIAAPIDGTAILTEFMPRLFASDFHLFVSFDYIADLNIVEVVYIQTALHADRCLFHIVFEAFE